MKIAAPGLAQGACRDGSEPLKGRVLAMIFEQPSTRTRVSFEVAMRQLGGETLRASRPTTCSSAAARRSPTRRGCCRAMSMRSWSAPKQHDHLHGARRACDRAGDQRAHRQIASLPGHGRHHDLEEHRGAVDKQTVAWVGDGNNVAASWIHAVTRLGGELRLGCPRRAFAQCRGCSTGPRTQGAKVKVTTLAGRGGQGCRLRRHRCLGVDA